jgi:hypothetical protein
MVRVLNSDYSTIKRFDSEREMKTAGERLQCHIKLRHGGAAVHAAMGSGRVSGE